MHPNATLIEGFYTAFATRDAETMAAAYHPDATFSDPVFQGLTGTEAGMMWRMLCERGEDLVVRHRDVSADDETGSAHWDADYTFSVSGRMVNNSIDASFRFREGRIIEHIDRFDFWKWTRMALGPTGLLLGWTPIVQNRVRTTAGKQLDRYIEKHS